MSRYKIVVSQKAEKDLIKLAKSEPKAYNKAIKLIRELEEHPTTGTGKPEKLKWSKSGEWSRRITEKHRLIYDIVDDVIEILILSSYGHYDDK